MAIYDHFYQGWHTYRPGRVEKLAGGAEVPLSPVRGFGFRGMGEKRVGFAPAAGVTVTRLVFTSRRPRKRFQSSGVKCVGESRSHVTCGFAPMGRGARHRFGDLPCLIWE